MYKRLPTATLRGELRNNPFGILAISSIVALCLLVTVVGTFAIAAQTLGTWQSLFYMEQAFAITVPTVKALLALSVAASVVFVLRR